MKKFTSRSIRIKIFKNWIKKKIIKVAREIRCVMYSGKRIGMTTNFKREDNGATSLSY